MAKVLFDSGSSFSYISESFAAEMEDRQAKLAFHLNVVTPLGEHSLAWRYLQSVSMALNGKEFNDNLIIMDMQEYDVILGMDWLGQHSTLIDCTRRRVYFESAGEGSLFVQGVCNGERKLLISAMKA